MPHTASHSSDRCTRPTCCSTWPPIHGPRVRQAGIRVRPRRRRRRALRVPPARPARRPADAGARRDARPRGALCYDTMTLVGPGTWRADQGAVDAALTAADLRRRGRTVAYAICRPPGHHTTKAAYGGSCYLNNAGIAAEALRASGRGSGRGDRHRCRPRQRYAGDLLRPVRRLLRILHVDPGEGWFPHYAGYADERGPAPARRQPELPIAPGTGDDVWLGAVARACDRPRRARCPRRRRLARCRCRGR